MNTTSCTNCASPFPFKSASGPYCRVTRNVAWDVLRHPDTLKCSFGEQHSKSWARRIRLIERAGGAAMPHWYRLTAPELLSVFFNLWAMLLGPLYFIWLGLWWRAVAVSVIGLLIPGALLQLLKQLSSQRSWYAQLGLSGTGWMVWLALWLAAAFVWFGLRANLDVYRQCKRTAGWRA